METILYPKWNTFAAFGFVGCTLASAWIAQTPSTAFSVSELPKLHIETQRVHAKELLSRAPQSLDQSLDLESSERGFIFHVLQENLPRDYKSQAPAIAQTLIEESNRYDLDPIFLLAVIKTESRFNPKAVGRHGDLGLMQLLPTTGAWVAQRLKMPSPVDLKDPVTNIRVGAAYFAQLRRHFGHVGSRYLAAYNMGIKNVHRLLSKEVEPMIYAKRVLANYRALYASFDVAVSSKRTLISYNN